MASLTNATAAARAGGAVRIRLVREILCAMLSRMRLAPGIHRRTTYWVALGVLLSSCAMPRRAPDLTAPPVQSLESCKQWCAAVAATCLNRCQREAQQCRDTCAAQRLECLTSC